MDTIFNVPEPKNEPIYGYLPGSKERQDLVKELERQANEIVEIPVIIGGKEYYTGDTQQIVMPHDHGHVLARFHRATPDLLKKAIDVAMEKKKEWSRFPWYQRASIFLKAAQLLSTKWRMVLNAATMLGQSKVVFQAEIDSACELIDFYRFNPYYMSLVYREQPPISPVGTWNYIDARPLDGFVFAVTPFNFTSIAGNLPTSPAMMGNTVVWKPASTAVLSAYYLMKLWEEAGLPPGVINFVPAKGKDAGPVVIKDSRLGGIHFTGSTSTFQSMWKTVGENIANYNCYPRLVGETGGKDFIFAHPSCDLKQLNAAVIRGAFEYQGQKCSAASRLYIPESLWPKFKEMLIDEIKTIGMGDVRDFKNLMGAIIDRASFEKIKGYIERAKESPDAEILYGGGCDDSVGFFIEPTVILAKRPDYESMREEIFGPVLTVYIYKDKDYEETLRLCDSTSPYALTGSIFATDRKAIMLALDILRFSAGNFYINDKPTGAVVGQQPFGGSRASGTNDKAGSVLNLLRWTTMRTIKENFVPPSDYRYPHMRD